MTTTADSRRLRHRPAPSGWVIPLLIGLWLAGCGRPAPAPAREPGHRIVSLVPSVTEMLFAIGAGDQVVGVSTFDRYPPDVATRPRVGALVDPDIERILRLRPDLVIVYGSQDELIARLARSGIGTFRYRHAGLADITATLEAIGARIGRAREATTLAASIDAGLDQVRAAVRGRPRPSTALIIGRERGSLRGLYASGGVGFLHDVLELAGGRDVFGDVAREGLQISTETLLARAPEVILELHASAEGWPADAVPRERAVWTRLAAVPAVRNGRVTLLVDDKLTVPGPRIVEVARTFADVLHPGALGAR